MIKTPVQQAIDEVKRQAAKYSDAGIPIGAYIHCEAILQSLLTVEQEQMDKARIEFAEWVMMSGYGYIRGMGWKHVGDIVKKEMLSTTDLLQLFNQQTDKK